MKTFNNKKRAATLITVATLAFIFLFTACKQTGGGGSGTGGGGTPTPTPKPKHAIAFSVEGSGGTLKAKADDVDETEKSPISIEEGKTVTFTATPEASYRVKEWKVDGEPVADAGKSNTYTHTVTKVATITVSFEEIPKHEVTFSVDGVNGTLIAKADGVAETEASPINVEEGKTVTFTAKANEGYQVKDWTLDGKPIAEAGTSTEYTHTVKGPCAITVSFEPGKAILTLNAEKLTIKVKAKTADGSAIQVEGCNEATLASDTETTLTTKGTKVILKGNITEFRCKGSYNNKQSLTALDVQGLTSLQKLSCGWNELTVLEVQGLTALQELDCKGNKLASLNAQGCTSLKVLKCHWNKLTELNVQGLIALHSLWCQRNKLSTLDVQGLNALKYLGCFSNKLDATAMIKLLNDLPTRTTSDKASCTLYTEKTGEEEDNCKNFRNPPELKAAFKGAKKRNWKLTKIKADGWGADL